MEAEELAIVLSRASDLHIKITDAIERSMKNQRAAAGADSPSTVLDAVSSENSASGSPTHFRGVGLENFEGEVLSDSKPWQGPSREARSLVAIREALETLEIQLEDLQKLQQVQMQERENVLAELEESRRMLLRRLREHQGKEWEVVNEALAFAGEPVEDLAEDDDEFADDEEYADEDAPEEDDGVEEEEDGVEDASPEVGENSDGGEEEQSPVTPRSNYSDVLQGSVLDPVSNLEASLNMVADDGDEEEDESENEGSGGLRGFGRALLKVAGGALAVAAAMAAFDFAKERGGRAAAVPQGKAGGGGARKGGGQVASGTPGGAPPDSNALEPGAPEGEERVWK